MVLFVMTIVYVTIMFNLERFFDASVALDAWRGWAYLAASCVFMALVWLLCVFNADAKESPTIRTLVAEGRCGHCGQIIAGLSQEEDGCIVCPGCSAAWRASSVLVDRAQAETPWSVRMASRLAARPEGAWSIRESHCRAGYVDARGIIMPILKPRDGLLSREVVSAMGEERNARIEKALTPNRRSEWGIVALAALAYGAIAVLALSGFLVRMTPEGTYGEMSFVVPLLLCLPVVLFPVLLFRAPASISVSRAVQVRLNEGVCPTCAAALPPADGDAGQSKCECCGAMWNHGVDRDAKKNAFTTQTNSSEIFS